MSDRKEQDEKIRQKPDNNFTKKNDAPIKKDTDLTEQSVIEKLLGAPTNNPGPPNCVRCNREKLPVCKCVEKKGGGGGGDTKGSKDTNDDKDKKLKLELEKALQKKLNPYDDDNTQTLKTLFDKLSGNSSRDYLSSPRPTPKSSIGEDAKLIAELIERYGLIARSSSDDVLYKTDRSEINPVIDELNDNADTDKRVAEENEALKKEDFNVKIEAKENLSSKPESQEEMYKPKITNRR